MGSSIGTSRYRPVEITPTAASPVYSVRMANADPTTEGFDRTLKDSSLCLINPDFYHRINSSGADSADITIYFDDSLDNAYQAIAHWQNVPQWENTGAVTLISNVSPILSSITRSAWTDFSYTPFALAAPVPVVSLSNSASAICVGDTVIFTATPGFTNYTFFVNSNTVQNGTDSIYTTASVSSGDTISVVITTVGCNAKSNEITSIIVNPLPVVNLGTDTIVCGSAILNASNAGATFNWSTTDTTQTIIADTTDTYWVDVTNTNGCTTRDSINVTVNPAPLVYLGADTTLCGGTVPLDAGNAGAAFTWSTTDTTQTIIVDSTSIYWVDVSDTATGCTTRDSIEVTINSLPIKSLGTDTSACGSHTLDAGNSGALFSWSTTDTSQTIVVNTTNTYWVDVTIGGCTTRDSNNVTINPIPAVDLGPDTTICDTCSIILDAGTGFTIYNWSTSDTVQTLIVDLAGTYSVQVTDADGCTNADTVIVSKNVVVEESFIFVPSAFSPNGDGVNDLFRITGIGITNIYLVVYNRWGEMVFETRIVDEAMNAGWNGKHNGEEQGMAVFVYYLEVEFNDGEKQTKKGDITLIR